MYVIHFSLRVAAISERNIAKEYKRVQRILIFPKLDVISKQPHFGSIVGAQQKKLFNIKPAYNFTFLRTLCGLEYIRNALHIHILQTQSECRKRVKNCCTLDVCSMQVYNNIMRQCVVSSASAIAKQPKHRIKYCFFFYKPVRLIYPPFILPLPYASARSTNFFYDFFPQFLLCTLAYISRSEQVIKNVYLKFISPRCWERIVAARPFITEMRKYPGNNIKYKGVDFFPVFFFFFFGDVRSGVFVVVLLI